MGAAIALAAASFVPGRFCVCRMCWWHFRGVCSVGSGLRCMRCCRLRLPGCCGRRAGRSRATRQLAGFLVLAALGACGRSALVRARVAGASCSLQQDTAAGCRDLWVPVGSATRWRRVRSTAARARPGHRAARVRLVCADRDCAGPRDGLPACSRGLAAAAALASAFFFTFAFIAIPEELFFRGWLQNLLERRLGRTPALLVTAVLFGLSHFNKRAAHFNWRYVVLAATGGNLLRAGVAARPPGRRVRDHACAAWTRCGLSGCGDGRDASE